MIIIVNRFTSWLIPKQYDACTRLFVTFIRPEFKNDVALIEHEKTHQRQFWKNPLHGYFYLFSKAYRLKVEVEAYRVQLQYDPSGLDDFAKYLSENYNLDITFDEAKKLLT
jgi:hypothetical protein